MGGVSLGPKSTSCFWRLLLGRPGTWETGPDVCSRPRTAAKGLAGARPQLGGPSAGPNVRPAENVHRPPPPRLPGGLPHAGSSGAFGNPGWDPASPGDHGPWPMDATGGESTAASPGKGRPGATRILLVTPGMPRGRPRDSQPREDARGSQGSGRELPGAFSAAACAWGGGRGGVKVNLRLPRSAQHARKSSRESSHCHGHYNHYARDVSGFARACRATRLVKGPHFVLPSSGRVAELRARLRTFRLRGPMHVRVGVPAPLSPQ